MCLSTNPGRPPKVEKVPILPGPESKADMVNDTVVTNITDRSKQKEARGQFRDYGGRDKYRHFDEEAAVNPSGSKSSGTTTTKKGRQSSNRTSRGGVSGTKSGRGSVGRGKR
tara:strand:+ start:298 stop:633 length:336 start_codon:yes stop_codon:yes gene_type:complete